MRDKLHQYLLGRPAGASPRELLELVFTQPGTDAEFGPRFLHVLLAADPRFVWRPNDGTWCARQRDGLAHLLGETEFVVVDVETTGTAASATGIIEIGAARVCGGRIVGEFQQLINPGQRLPAFITWLTGINDAALADQPPISDVWPHFMNFLGESVIVAHNAPFDLGFLNAAARACSGQSLAHPHLCTLKLARRLIPELRRRGLDHVAAHFGIPLLERHRALGDVRITVEVFFQLLERMAARGVVRLDQALDLQQHARDGRPFICLLPRDTVERLPAQPGIYQFLDENGRLLYVGKAKSLRARVGSYLSNASGHSNKTLDLIRHIRDVRVEVAGSELEAALREAEAIRRLQPPYNRLRKHLPKIAFLKLGSSDAYPRLSITTRIGAGSAQYIGPFCNRGQAEDVLRLLTRLFRLRTCAGRLRPDAAVAPCFHGQVDACTAPCAARVTWERYREQVDACLTFLRGDGTAAERELIRRRDEHAAGMCFEAAARAQHDLRLLHMVLRRQRTLGWITAQQNFVVLQPAADRLSVLVYAVVGGRLALRAQLTSAAQVEALAETLRERWPEFQRTRLRPDDVDGTTILAAWLRDRGEADGCAFRVEDAAVPATQVAEWRAACGSLFSDARVQTDALQRPAAQPEPEGQRGEQPRPAKVIATRPE